MSKISTLRLICMFYKQFEKWCESYKGPKKVKVINDHTTSNHNRLGAIGDLKYVIDTENINDEILVMASYNIFDFSLCDFVDMYRSKNADTDVVACRREK